MEQIMGTNVTGKFHSREDADAVVERLVQEYGVNRADIFVAAAGTENSAGDEPSGADFAGGEPSPGDRDDAPLSGAVEVSVDINDADSVDRVRATFAEFSGT
jgi:hypothetical protein